MARSAYELEEKNFRRSNSKSSAIKLAVICPYSDMFRIPPAAMSNLNRVVLQAYDVLVRLEAELAVTQAGRFWYNGKVC
jgi:hypothetical protein